MQSKTTRGLRRLLVSTGVISLVLSVAAPAALADKPEGTPGNGPTDKQAELAPTDALGSEADKRTICHHNNGNGGVVIEVNENSINRDRAHGSDHHEDGTDTDTCTVDDGTPSDGNENAGSGNNNAGGNGNEDVVDEEQDGGPGGSDGTPGCGHDGNPTDQDSKNCDEDDDTTGGGDDDGDVTVGGDSTDGGTETPATDTPPEAQPVIVISDDAVSRPTPAVTPAIPAAPIATPATPATPAAPAAAPAANPNRGNEVLGSITTRTPGSASAGMTSLAATGLDSTAVLALIGSGLLLAGFALQVAARRQVQAATAVA